MKSFLKGLLLPLLVAAYPILFLFGQNASALDPGSLNLPLGSALLFTALAYGVFLLFQRKPSHASLAATLFALAYYGYGYLYHMLLKLDRFPVQHYLLLPLVLVLVGYAGYFLSFLKPKLTGSLQAILLVVASALVCYNVAITVPTEVQNVQAKASPVQTPTTQSSRQTVASEKTYPDIYYIVFDEYTSFDAIRQYWHMTYVDDFQAFLEQNHFFVASGSRSATLSTINEVSSRMNLHLYPNGTSSDILVPALQNNKVMQVVKSYGYTTVSINMAFQGIQADVVVPFDDKSNNGMAGSEFSQTFIDDTMLSALSDYLPYNNQTAAQKRDEVNRALSSTVNLQDIKTPKFVYTHILLPHMPFVFDKDGNALPPQAADDWHYYQGQHEYATQLMQQMIEDLLAQADPNNPPVIIIQGDHGARNLQRRTKDNIIMNGYLENYPAQLNQSVLNTMYLPGFDYTQLKSDMPPVQALAIVLNHYLNANVTVK